MSFNNIKKLLKNEIGLNANTVGASSIERAVGHRMDHLGLTSEASYYAFICKDKSEIEELVEEVVVPETWFFRNKTPFDALNKCVSEMVAARESLKILSLPCATGEEPYSIAMSLMTAGFSEADFNIDGVDVSKRALTKARRGIYGQHSFREDGVNIKDKFFKKTRSGYQVLPEVKKHVDFSRANIITDSICPSSEYYDIIFCRNLLIYFDRDTQNIVLDKLRLILKDGGILFVGHAETTQIKKEYFTKIDMPKAFAYRKTQKYGGADAGIGSVVKLKNIYDQLVEVTRKDAILSNKIRQPVKIKKTKLSAPNSPELTWRKVERMIDMGRYDEASLLCEKLLEEYPENADGYYYLGLIANLCGSTGGAESLLKKAIYLSPNHQKALSLSIVLAESRGDDDSADYYRRRETKARERNK